LAPGVTRVVFDLRDPASWESRQEQNPQRLVIDIHRTGPVRHDAPPPSGSTKLTIVIDPGHGGKDLGTTSPSGLEEKNLTLDVAKRLGLLLQERLGAHVVYTRDSDEFVSLDERAAVANRTQADFLISIHGNSSPVESVRGVETYYLRLPAASEKAASAARDLAADVHQGLLSGLAATHDGLRDRGVRQANFVVLRQAQMPAVLAEISFISNQKDAPRLKTASYREQIAKALYTGIVNHLSREASKSTAVADLAVQRWSGTP
jgi:N-acetylmuramoyl-L-alanine amidase